MRPRDPVDIAGPRPLAGVVGRPLNFTVRRMPDISVTAVPLGEETSESCRCCGRPIYAGAGDLTSEEGPLATYWYRWSEGHHGRFVLAVGRTDEGGQPVPGVLVVQAGIADGNITYGVLHPDDSPWESLSAFGRPLTRDEAFSAADRTWWFRLVDAIAANESRISSRILQAGLQA